MLDLIRRAARSLISSIYGRLLIVPLFALLYFLVAYFIYYPGGYDPPPDNAIPFEQVTAPASVHTVFTERPPFRPGLLVLDGGHRNDFSMEEISIFMASVSARGHTIDLIGQPSAFGGFARVDESERVEMLREKLRGASALAVIVPGDPYSKEETDLVESFVANGGRLLLIGDPTRDQQINTLAERFGITFQPGILYNQMEYDLNHQNVFIRDFRPDDVTRGLAQVALYGAGAIRSQEPGLAYTDGNTRSTVVEGIEPFYPVVKGGGGNVLAVGDLTFMVPPQHSILDNSRFIANITGFLTSGERRFTLADFPHFLKGEVDVLLGRSTPLSLGADLKRALTSLQVDAQVSGVENPGRDTVFIGLVDDNRQVGQYLDAAGIYVGPTIRTPFTPEFERNGSTLMVLQPVNDRHVLIILGDSLASLADVVEHLGTGKFREHLVSDFVGVIDSS